MDMRAARDALARRDAVRLRAELLALFPNDPESDRVAELVRFAIAGGEPPAGLSAETQVFLDSMAKIHSPTWAAEPHRRVSKELDFIANLGGTDEWGIAWALNRLRLELIEPTRPCAVVGTMRDDGIYLLEWVAHYLTLGFEHLFVYTNDNADGSDELLAALAAQGILTVMQSEVTGQVPPETKAFGHALDLVPELRLFDWALFVDSDEFLILHDDYHHSVPALLDAVAANPQRIGAVCYDWLWFISDMTFQREPGLLCERFQHARPHFLSKCLVRLRDVQSMRLQHIPELMPGRAVVDSALLALDVDTYWQRRTPQYSGGRINHYWPRSFEEFVIKKARGAALGGEHNLYDRPYSLFFTWNGFGTPENRYPTDANLLRLTQQRIESLRRLDGVAAAADRIERGFPVMLAKIGDEPRLRRLYAQNRREPGDL
jgi:hypothetical protein